MNFSGVPHAVLSLLPLWLVFGAFIFVLVALKQGLDIRESLSCKADITQAVKKN